MAVEGKLTYFDDFLNDEPTLSELCEHVTLGTDWYVFGVLLKLDSTKLDAIKAMNEENPYFKATKMFKLWLDTNPNPTRKEILETLEKPAIGKNAVAKEYKKVIKEMVQKATINQILQTHSDSLSHLVLPTDVTETLCTEGVISKETFDEIESSSGSLAGGLLKALSSAVSEDPSKLRTFGTVLLHSRDTVDVAKDILKDYDKNFPQVYVSSPQKQSDTTALNTPLQNTGMAITKSNVTEVHLEPEYQYKLDEIKGKLGKLFLTVTYLIESTVGFELKKLKRSLRLSYPELKPQLSIAESVDDVMDIVRAKCTIINIACLEAIINHCNIKSAEQCVTDYKLEVETFCEKVKLSVCKNENFITSSSSLLKCETIEFTLEWNIDEHTLSEIKELLWKAFGKIAKRVLVKVVNETNSIIVTCYAPRHIMDILLMEAEKNLDLLRGIGLMKLTIGYCTIWDITTKDKYVKDLEEMVIAQRKTLAENDQLIIGLKSSLEDTTTMDSEQQQDQSPTNTLSEKIKLLDRMNKAKTFDVEKLTREKEDPLLHVVAKQIESGHIVGKKSVSVQTESMELSVDVSVQFDYLVPLNDSLQGVHIASKKLFLIQGDSPQLFDWEQYGLKMTILEGTLSPTDTSEVAISALVGGQFQFPEGTELISAVYGISVSKPLFRPVKIEIQHCADLVTQDHTSYLSFVTASLGGLPYHFQLEEERGQFHHGGQYGSVCLIYLSQFSLKAIVKSTSLKQSIQDTSLTSKSDIKVSIESTQDVMPFPDIKYAGQVVYEVKHLNSEWLMRFIVAKDLNALLEYIKESLPNVDKDVSLSFKFEYHNGHIELILNEEQECPFNGWNICPQKIPVVIHKSDVDRFGSEMPPQFPSILITISTEYGRNTVTTLNYPVSLKGIKPDNTKIYIVRSISSASSKEGASSIISAFKSTSTRQSCTFDSVPDRHVLLELLADIKHLWYEIGVALKVPDEELEVLHQKNISDINKLSKVLQYWIDWGAEVTWRSIITAVRSKIIGQTQISQEIESYVIQAKVESAASYRDPVLSGDKVKEVRKIIQDVLTTYQSALDGLLKASIKPFAVDMYSHSLISETTKDTANFNDMMREFKSGMDFIHDGHKLVKHCQLFLQSLVKQGGPHKDAASSIAEEWTANIKEKLNINIEFDIE